MPADSQPERGGVGDVGGVGAGAATAGEADAGERLDRWLAARLEVARNQVQGWIRAELVRVNGAVARGARLLVAGDRIEWEAPPPSGDHELVPEAGELPVLHADAELIVIDKPAGLTVHPGAGRQAGTLVHRLLSRFPEVSAVGGPGRPGIVHRLDRGTSGALLIARTPRAYQALTRAFAAREVRKLYLAIAYGRPAASTGRIELAIGRHPSRRTEMTVRRDGRPALTSYRVLATAPGASLLELDIATGRTHQIRVHLRAIGHPLLGDPVYGEARWKALPPLPPTVRAAARDFPRPALHAWRLALRHPASGEPTAFEAPPAADLVALWAALGGAWPDTRAGAGAG